MAIKNFILPYDNDELRYDYKNHRYVLQVDHASYEVARQLVEVYQGQENAEAILEKVSQIVYDYIYSFKKSELYERMQYYLSHSKEMREAVRQLMLDVLFYGFQEGGWAMAYVTGINLQEVEKLDIPLKVAVGEVGDSIARSRGLAQKFIKYDFDVVESNPNDKWWYHEKFIGFSINKKN